MLVGERLRKNAVLNLRSSSSVTSVNTKRSSSVKTSRFSTSIRSELSPKQGRESKRLRPREFLLLFIEASVSIAYKVIRDRFLDKPNQTEHHMAIYGLYLQGYSTFVSMLVGFLADSYVNYYTVAFISVTLHFAAICIHTMESVLRSHPRGDQYRTLVWNVCAVAIVLIKSTDFTRLVYGLEGMTRRTRPTIYCYIFLHFWVSSYATYGGIFTTTFSGLWDTASRASGIPLMSFTLTGLSVFLFVYFLHPETVAKEPPGMALHVVGCILLSIYYKMFRRRRRRLKSILRSTDTTFDKMTISATKGLLTLYGLVLPASGYILSTVFDTCLFYDHLLSRVKTDEFINKIGHPFLLARMIMALFMLLSYFGLWPLLTFIGVKRHLSVKFLIGHLLILMSMFYAAIMFKQIEKFPYDAFSGYIRVYNTRNEPVELVPDGMNVGEQTWTIEPHDAIMVYNPCRKRTLIFARIIFNGTKSKYALFLNFSPGQVTGYVLLDPPEIGRIRGPYLPIYEGPPGTNRRGWPRVFIYNTATKMKRAKILIERIEGNPSETSLSKEIQTNAGDMTTIALEEGKYSFILEQSRAKRTIDIKQGGFYGILVHTTTSTKELDVDEILGPSTASPWPLVCRYCIEGLGAGLGYPSLRAIVYLLAPQGLLAMSFAYLAFLEGVALGVQWFGFETWHRFSNSHTLFTYSCAISSFFFISVFTLFKYHELIK